MSQAIYPEIETVVLGEKRAAIVVRVYQERGTYVYDGRPYIRHGTTTQVMPQQEYRRRLLKAMQLSWQPFCGIIRDDFVAEGSSCKEGEGILLGKMHKRPQR